MNRKKVLQPAKKISANAALGIGMAAGFAFLFGLGAGLDVLPKDIALLFGFGVALFASVGLLLSQK